MAPLITFLENIPAIDHRIGSGFIENGLWWVKFGIDIDHPLAWRVVQELGHILNYISIEEPLPTVFKPVSPPVYMNGGPREFLSWVIESKAVTFTPTLCAEWLKGRMPSPVGDLIKWELED
jgi:hypothetical protein